jgi:hypothetical protein
MKEMTTKQLPNKFDQNFFLWHHSDRKHILFFDKKRNLKNKELGAFTGLTKLLLCRRSWHK